MTTHASSFLQPPGTRTGWWSAGLLGLFLVMFIINLTVFMPATQETWWRTHLLPFYDIFMLLCGLAACIIGLIALFRKHERSWLVWFNLFPGGCLWYF